LFTTLYLAKALAYGVVRTTGCGLPPSVRQLEEKKVKEAQKGEGMYGCSKTGEFVGLSGPLCDLGV
jgi:hypothetical protein